MPDAPVDVAPTDSSPVIVPASPVALSDLTPQERQQWRKTGDKPARSDASADSDPTPHADSSPAVPADPASATAPLIPSASEPDTPARKKQNAESRKAELDAEIQTRLSRRRQLDQEIAEHEARLTQVQPAREPVTPAAPAAAADGFPELEVWLELPGNESKGIGAYTQAAIAFDRERATREATIQQTKLTRRQAYDARLTAGTKEDPEWRTKVAPELLALKPFDQLSPGEPLAIPNVLAQEIYEAPEPYALLRYLTDHPDVRQELLRLDAPYEVIRRINRLSAQLAPPVSSVVPAVKTTTDAPPPPPALGSRAYAQDDEVLVAARSGDFRRYRDAANAADVARLKARGR